MKFNLLLLTFLSSTLLSCSSSQERTFENDYKVIDASKKIFPEWIDNPEKQDIEKERKNNRYFVSESENINQRICTRSAEARATAKIAIEISQFIKNSYGESVQNTDNEVQAYMEERLAQEAQSFIVGAEVKETYWEKRKYQQDENKKEKTIFYCYALIKMSKNNLDKAINNSMAKLYASIKNPEVKEETKKALNDVAEKFNKLEE